MIHILLQGILLGFTLAVFIGPSFFTLLQTSIHRGFRSAVLLALGIFLSDCTLIMLSYIGAAQIVDKPENQMAFGFVGGLILIIIGIYTFSRKVHIETDESEMYSRPPHLITYVVKGYILNIANPFLWIFWIGVMGYVTANISLEEKIMAIFYAGTLGTVLFTDLVKSYIANKIKSFLKPKLMTNINRVIGIVLVVFGVVLIWKVL